MKTSVLKVVSRRGKSQLSSNQKTFNTLIKRIQLQREQLKIWNTTAPLYKEKYITEIVPLEKTYYARRADLVRLLDQAYTQYTLNKTHKRNLAAVIADFAKDLISEDDTGFFKDLYNQYGDNDYDEEAEAEKSAINEMMQDFFGVELDDDVDIHSIKNIFSNLNEKMKQKTSADELNPNNTSRARKKSAKAIAREAKQQEEAQHATQSIREIFRKLAKDLHPDREQNPAEQQRKSGLMQRVNVAYNNKDLLALLELQLEVEQIAQADINCIAEDRLKHYNKVLKDQLHELNFQIDTTRTALIINSNLNPEHEGISPKNLMTLLSKELDSLKHAVINVEKELSDLQDIKQLKNWLNSLFKKSSKKQKAYSGDELMYW